MRRTLGWLAAAATFLAASAAFAPTAFAQEGSATAGYQDSRRTDPVYGDARAYNPASALAEYGRGLTAMKAKDYHAAVRAFGHVVDVQRRNAAAWRLLGAAYAGTGAWRKSERAYDRALKYAPDDIASHAGLGAALLALNDPKAQQQAEWLKARARACGETCPEAAVLKTLETRGPFAAS